jgi:hypothetical protein
MASEPASQGSVRRALRKKVLPASQSLESLSGKIAVLQGHKTTPRCPGGRRKLVPHRGQVKVTGGHGGGTASARSQTRRIGGPVQSWHAPQYPWRSSSG